PSAGIVERQAGASVGWAPQRPAQYGRLSPRENLELFARLGAEERPERSAERLLEEFELPRDGVLAGELSVGNRQRLNLAIALLGAPARPPPRLPAPDRAARRARCRLREREAARRTGRRGRPATLRRRRRPPLRRQQDDQARQQGRQARQARPQRGTAGAPLGEGRSRTHGSTGVHLDAEGNGLESEARGADRSRDHFVAGGR